MLRIRTPGKIHPLTPIPSLMHPALTSHSNVTETRPQTTRPTFTPSTPSPSTPNTELSLLLALMEHSTSGTESPNTDSRGIHQSAVRSQQQLSTKLDPSSPTLSATTGARVMHRTHQTTPTKSDYILSTAMSANRDLASRSDRYWESRVDINKMEDRF